MSPQQTREKSSQCRKNATNVWRFAFATIPLALTLATVSFTAAAADSGDIGSPSTLSDLSTLEQCRLFPTWTVPDSGDELFDNFNISYATCSRATNYFPHNYGLFNGSSWEFPWKDLTWLYRLQECVQDRQDDRLQQYRQELQHENDKDFWTSFLEEYPLQPPSVKFEYPSLDALKRQHEQEGAEHVPPVAVIVEHALHQREADTLQDARQCIQQHHAHLTENRPFGAQYDNGGNNCVFLGAFLQWLAPGVAAQVRQTGHVAWRQGQWGDFGPPNTDMHPDGYVSPLYAGIRTSGHLSYDGWEALGPHKDNDSLYTVLIMLSRPDDYHGGELYMKVARSGKYQDMAEQIDFDESHPPMIAKPDQYSAVVFMADENTHQVLDIRGGDRQTIGTEFWEYGDAPFGIMRPSPDMWRNHQRNSDWWKFD